MEPPTTMSETVIVNRTDDTQIEKWAKQALIMLDCDIRTVRIEWNGRFTRRMGDAGLKNGIGVVRLSKPLWPRATEMDRQQTVVHEVCHVVQRYRHGRLDTPHGKIWQHYMKTCGFQPRRCHSVNLEGLRRNIPKYAARCSCQTHQIGLIRARRMMAGISSYRCKKCNTQLTLIEGYDT
jgi:SprT protein